MAQLAFPQVLQFSRSTPILKNYSKRDIDIKHFWLKKEDGSSTQVWMKITPEAQVMQQVP